MLTVRGALVHALTLDLLDPRGVAALSEVVLRVLVEGEAKELTVDDRLGVVEGVPIGGHVADHLGAGRREVAVDLLNGVAEVVAVGARVTQAEDSHGLPPRSRPSISSKRSSQAVDVRCSSAPVFQVGAPTTRESYSARASAPSTSEMSWASVPRASAISPATSSVLPETVPKNTPTASARTSPRPAAARAPARAPAARLATAAISPRRLSLARSEPQ